MREREKGERYTRGKDGNEKGKGKRKGRGGEEEGEMMREVVREGESRRKFEGEEKQREGKGERM